MSTINEILGLDEPLRTRRPSAPQTPQTALDTLINWKRERTQPAQRGDIVIDLHQDYAKYCQQRNVKPVKPSLLADVLVMTGATRVRRTTKGTQLDLKLR